MPGRGASGSMILRGALPPANKPYPPPVGASLLAKAKYPPTDKLTHRFREQARSHRGNWFS
jgi:hypothetical protein